MDRDRRSERAAARCASATLRKTLLGDERDTAPTTGGEAVSLVTRLTCASFGLARRTAYEHLRNRSVVRFVPRERP